MVYKVGETINLPFFVTKGGVNSTGQTVVATIYSNTNVTSAGTVTEVGSGIYTVAVTPDAAGEWKVYANCADALWEGTIAFSVERGIEPDLENGGCLDLIFDDTLADTNELQAEWVDGGRLDLLIDGIRNNDHFCAGFFCHCLRVITVIKRLHQNNPGLF